MKRAGVDLLILLRRVGIYQDFRLLDRCFKHIYVRKNFVRTFAAVRNAARRMREGGIIVNWILPSCSREVCKEGGASS